jgi:PAS domain S-box-containing protein
MLDRHHWDFMAEADRAPAIEATRQRPGEGVEKVELRYLRKDGTPVWMIVTSNVVDDPATGAQGVLGMVTDITDRKQAEEALRAAEAAALESERKYRSIVETANEGIWTLDHERRTTYVNPRMAEMLGYAPAEMLGRHHWDFMSVADRETAIAATRNRPPDKAIEREEVRYLRKDGSTRWMLVTSSIIEDPAGGAPGVLGMVTDITDRKQAEAAAAASEARFRGFAEIASDWMWETDAQHRLTFMSGTPLRTHKPYRGLTRCELAGADPASEPWRSHFADLEAQRPFRDMSFEMLGSDGRIHYLVSNGRPVYDAHGAFIGYRGATSDRTRQHEAEAAAAESEKKYRQFVETANEGVWMVDAELKTAYVNPRVAELLGYTVDEIVGRPFLDFKHARDHAASLKLWDARKNLGLDRIETRLRRRDGSSLWVLMSATPRFGGDGQLDGSFIMIVDITDRKAAEAQAARAKREVDAILTSISDGFVAVDNEWRFTYVNAAAERIVGRTSAELLGKSALNMVKGGGDNFFGASYRVAKRDNEPAFFTSYSDTMGLWLEVRAYPHPDGLTIFFRDVTAERQSHRALAESERKFRQIVETASEGLWITSAEAEIVFANRRLEEILGYGPGELVGKSVFETIPQDRRDEVRRHWSEREVGKPGRFEARHLRKDGSEVSMLLSATPMFDGEGAFCGTFVMFVDISEQRRVQTALEESERRLRAALESNESILASISDGFVALDNEWRFTFINPAAERMWNKKAEELLGKTIFNSLQVDPANPFQSNYLESKRSGEPIAFTAYSEMFGKWIEVRGYPHAAGYTLFFDDITEQRNAHRALLKSQKKLQAAREMNERIFETSLDLICITDRNGDFLQVNPGACQQFGYPAEELLGHNASEFIHADGIAATRHALRDARTSLSLHTFENRCRRKSGQYVPMNWSVAWSEREQKYFLIGRDMSERIEAQERLNRSQRLEAIGQLTGGIAHDFNNLLTVIMGNSDTLARGLKDNENLRRRAELSLEASRRAAELTAQLLAFARRQTLAPKAVDANRLVREMQELMRRSLGAQIEIDFRPAPALWLCKIDSTQIETALLNLALNARDAMPEGGRLTITTANRSVAASGPGSVADLAEGEYVAIEVADTGTGMPPDVLARAFEPFFTTKDIGKGSGLGLAMVYGFVKQSGGHVAIDSEAGRGTRVTLYLPRAKGDVAAATPASGRDGAPLPGGRETILVVEDDAAVRELVTDQLRRLGYRVLVAGNGPTARNILYGGDKVDLLFTDVLMPGGITGTQLAEEAERQIPGLKVLFTTGYSEVPALKQSKKGMSLLRKPYKTHDLAHTVRHALDSAT